MNVTWEDIEQAVKMLNPEEIGSDVRDRAVSLLASGEYRNAWDFLRELDCNPFDWSDQERESIERALGIGKYAAPSAPEPNETTHVCLRMAYAVCADGEAEAHGWTHSGGRRAADVDMMDLCGGGMVGDPVLRGYLEAWIPRPVVDKAPIECEVMPKGSSDG